MPPSEAPLSGSDVPRHRPAFVRRHDQPRAADGGDSRPNDCQRKDSRYTERSRVRRAGARHPAPDTASLPPSPAGPGPCRTSFSFNDRDLLSLQRTIAICPVRDYGSGASPVERGGRESRPVSGADALAPSPWSRASRPGQPGSACRSHRPSEFPARAVRPDDLRGADSRSKVTARFPDGDTSGNMSTSVERDPPPAPDFGAGPLRRGPARLTVGDDPRGGQPPGLRLRDCSIV